MKFSRLTTNGRVTIPAPLRKKHNLILGRRVKFWHSHSFGRTTENGIIIIPLSTSKEIETNIGFLETKGKLLKALMDEKRRERKL